MYKLYKYLSCCKSQDPVSRTHCVSSRTIPCHPQRGCEIPHVNRSTLIVPNFPYSFTIAGYFHRSISRSVRMWSNYSSILMIRVAHSSMKGATGRIGLKSLLLLHIRFELKIWQFLKVADFCSCSIWRATWDTLFVSCTFPSRCASFYVCVGDLKRDHRSWCLDFVSGRKGWTNLCPSFYSQLNNVFVYKT